MTKLTKTQEKRFDEKYCVKNDPHIGEYFDRDEVSPGNIKQHLAQELDIQRKEIKEELSKYRCGKHKKLFKLLK